MLGVPLFSVSLEDTLMDGSQIAGNASLPNQEQLALPPPAGASSDERGLGAARRRLFLASMATAQKLPRSLRQPPASELAVIQC